MRTTEELFPGGGEAGALIRARDWAATPLGPSDGWPGALIGLVRAILHARQPMLLWWGSELVQVYNDAFRPSLGEGKHPTAMGQRARECWPEVWPIVGGQIEQVLRTGEASWYEDVLVPIFRNGSVEDAWWIYNYSPAFDDDGRIVGVLIICTETTAGVVARKQLEAAKRQAELAREELHGVFMQAPQPMAILTGREHRFTLVNPAYDVLVGGRPVLGRPLAEAFSEVEVGYYLPVLDEVYRTGKPIVIREAELHLRNAEGVVDDRYLDVTYHPYRGPDLATVGVMVLINDVTPAVLARNQIERAGRERRTLTETIEQSGDFIGLARPDGSAAWINEAGRSLVGLGKKDRISDHSLLDLVAPAEQARLREEILPAVVRSGRWEGEVAFRHLRTEGSIAVWFSLFEVRDTDGAVIALGTVTRDIRPQKALERERAAMLEREQSLRVAAEAAGQARDEFLAMLGHELRNPLAPISTATQLMRLRGDHHEKERQIIERQVAHLSRLVDDLLDVARVARGKIELQRRPTEIADVVSKAVEMASPLLEQRAHELTMDVPRQGLVVDGDPVRLAQVIGNLVTNAAKYTPPRGQIEIRATEHGGAVTVTVCDNGPGIPDELMPRIFDLFVQGQQRIDRAEGGLGLGLALVKNLVTLHGGTVAAKNRAGGGSEFSVTVPTLAATMAHAPVELTVRERLIPAAHAPRRVLIVDDNEDAAELLSELLRDIGHEVVVAHDGPAALEALRTFRAEVGLLDLGLPGMDGFELARRIRRETDDNGRPRLIAVTGYGQANDRAETKAAGFDHHLTKPVAIEELARVIDGHDEA